MSAEGASVIRSASHITRQGILVGFVALVAVTVGCGSSDSAGADQLAAGTGGTPAGTGGTPAGTGGTSAGTGGTPAGTGGTSAGTGGTPAGTGGTPAGTGGTPAGTGGTPAGTGGAGGSGATPADPGLVVAFLGDQGLDGLFQPLSERVLQMVKSEGADFVVILGDFDYDDDPAAWIDMMEAGLGSDFPWLAVGGNHDMEEWPDYQSRIAAKLATIPAANCTGTPGQKQSCSYRGIQLVLSTVGLTDTDHEAFFTDELAASDHIWKICGWHMNQQGMQVGDKPDQTGWGVYQACQNGGGIITTGHEHSYGRTRTLTDLGFADRQHGATGPWDTLTVGRGKTFVVVSGMGGKGIREYDAGLHDGETWWATMFTSDWEMRQGAGQSALHITDNGGALFIEFGVDGDPRKARGTFKLLGSFGGAPRVADTFEILAE